MKSVKTEEQKTMKPANFAVIIAIVTEMARCLNKNIANVRVEPIDSRLTGDGTTDLARLIALNSRS
jgi:hypothetical protein